MPSVRSTYRTRNIDNIPRFNVRHTFLRNSYFPYIVTEWNNLEKSIRNSESFSIFKKNILKFIQPSPSSIFNCHNPKWVKLLTRLRLGLSHLCDLNFKKFLRFVKSYLRLWNWCWDVYSLSSSLPFFSDQILIFINNIRNVDNNILNLNLFSELLLFGNFSFNNTKNTSILNTTIEHIVSSKRFEVLLIFMYGCFIYLLLFSLLFKFSFFHYAIAYHHWLSIYTFLSCNSCTWFLV